MKASERVITQDLVNRIQEGVFDQIEVRSLFIHLRAYSNSFPVFNEVSQFVAHNDNRNKGLANDSLETMKLRMQFFIEYNSPKRPLDTTSPFPLWVKKLMVLQVDKSDDNKLQNEFNLTKEELKKNIRAGFEDHKKRQLAVIKKKKISKNTLSAINYILGFLSGAAAFTQDEVINDLIDVLIVNRIEIDKDLLLLQSDKLTLCVLLLLHDVEYMDDKKKRLGSTQISSETTSILHNARFVDSSGIEIDNPQTHGNLHISGSVLVENKDKEISISHSIMTTNLKAIEWCDEELFSIEKQDYPPPNIYKTLRLDVNLKLSEDFKLKIIS